MPLFLITFQDEDDEPNHLHMIAPDFETAIERCDAMRKSAQVEGEVWLIAEAPSPKRLN